MTDQPRERLDLSILGQVAGSSTPSEPTSDVPPTLSGGPDATRETTRPNPRTPGGTVRGRTARGSSRATSPRTGAASAPSDGPRTIRRDDETHEYRPGILVRPLTELYTAAGTMMLPLSPPVGTALVQNAEPCAQSLDNLARTNPAVRRALMSLLQTGAWGQVLAAHMPIILAIAVTYSPNVRRAMETFPDTSHDSTETVNPVSNGQGPTTGGRQP